jgi:hypothetical protein
VLAVVLLCQVVSAAELTREYYPDGKLRAEYQMTNGKRDGICRIYDQNGTLSLDETWKDGKRDGLTRIYSQDGSINAAVLWEDGALKSIQNADMGTTGWIPRPPLPSNSMVLWVFAAWAFLLSFLYFLILRSEH